LTIELLGSGVQGIGDGCDEGSGVGGRAGGGEGGGRDVGMRGVAPVGRGWGGEGWVADVARLRLLDLEGMCLLRVLQGAPLVHTRARTHIHTHTDTRTHTHIAGMCLLRVLPGYGEAVGTVSGKLQVVPKPVRRRAA
jgi:hypothetical protein